MINLEDLKFECGFWINNFFIGFVAIFYLKFGYEPNILIGLTYLNYFIQLFVFYSVHLIKIINIIDFQCIEQIVNLVSSFHSG